MVDIQSATAEIRRGKKKKKKLNKLQNKNIISTFAMQGGHKRSKILTICKTVVTPINEKYPH